MSKKTQPPANRITVRGANGWYVATEDEAGFHQQPLGGHYMTRSAAIAAANAEDDMYERNRRHVEKEAAIYAKKNPATAAYIAARAAGRAARNAWIESDEPRDWRVGGESWGGDGDDMHGGAMMLHVRPSEIDEKLKGECRRYWRCRKALSDWARPIDPVTNEPTDDGRVDVTTTTQSETP